MEDGPTFQTGQLVTPLVVMEAKRESDSVPILFLVMVGWTVKETDTRLGRVMLRIAHQVD